MDIFTDFYSADENSESTGNKGDMFSTVYMNAFSEHMAFVKIRNNSSQGGSFVCACRESFYSDEEDVYVDFYRHVVDSFSDYRKERSAIEMIQFNVYCLEIMEVIKEKTFIHDLTKFVNRKSRIPHEYDSVCEILTSRNERDSDILFLCDALLKHKGSEVVENIIQQRNKYILSN